MGAQLSRVGVSTRFVTEYRQACDSRGDAVSLAAVWVGGIPLQRRPGVTVSSGEKLILAMLAGIYKKLEIKHDIDPNVILAGVRGDNTWILRWEYGDMIDSSEDLPPNVKETCDILDMYRSIEPAFKRLSESEKERVKSNPSGAYATFQGFDGNNDDHYGVLSDLVNVIGKYEERKGGVFKSHSPVSLPKYRKMLAVFHSMSDRYPDGGLTGDQIISILKG
jgi:uncharacterized protein